MTIKISRTFFIVFFIILLTFSCKTKKDDIKQSDDFEKWLVTAQEFTNKGRYNKAIEILIEAGDRFPDIEVMALNYNIAFNYYKLNRFAEADKYIKRVRSLFESYSGKFSEEFIYENRKYVVLSDLLEERIVQDREDLKDPYHVKKDLEKNKKLRPKKKKNPDIEKQ